MMRLQQKIFSNFASENFIFKKNCDTILHLFYRIEDFMNKNETATNAIFCTILLITVYTFQ